MCILHCYWVKWDSQIKIYMHVYIYRIFSNKHPYFNKRPPLYIKKKTHDHVHVLYKIIEKLV